MRVMRSLQALQISLNENNRKAVSDLEFNEFLEEIIKCIKKQLDHGERVSVTSVLKNNQSGIYSLTILQSGENMSPAITVNPYYADYCRGVPLERIADQILRCYRESHIGGRFDLSSYTDFEKVKDKIVCKLVSYEKNQYILSRVPHRRFLDLAIVYYYKMDDPVIGKASILIQNAHMELWNIDQESLERLADENTLRLLPFAFMGIEDLLMQITGTKVPDSYPDTLKLYVLTNVEQYYGAVSMTFGSVLESVYQKLGMDFYILPSSIHECMVLKAEEDVIPEILQKIVEEINRECVDASEVLGTSVYRYDGERRKLEIAK